MLFPEPCEFAICMARIGIHDHVPMSWDIPGLSESSASAELPTCVGQDAGGGAPSGREAVAAFKPARRGTTTSGLISSREGSVEVAVTAFVSVPCPLYNKLSGRWRGTSNVAFVLD